MTLEISKKSEGTATILYLSGRVDSTSADQLSEYLSGAVTPETDKLVVDLSGLMFITSAGFRSLLLAHREAEVAKCSFALSGVRDDMEALFNVTGFSRLFKIFSNADEAITALN